MQIFGLRENFSFDSKPEPTDIAPLDSRIFTKLECSHWNEGSITIPYVPDLTGEIEVVARIDAQLDRSASKEAIANLPLSYALGIDFGSGQRGRQDGQWWRSKGAVGYTPVGRFVSGENTILDLREHAVDLNVVGSNGTQSNISLAGMRETVPEVISHINEYCHLAPGDLIFLGALCFIRDFSSSKDITATCEVLPTLHLQSSPQPNNMLKLTLMEDNQ